MTTPSRDERIGSRTVDLKRFGMLDGVVPAPEVQIKFDHRARTTGRWMGADVAFSVMFPDGLRWLWWFGDTHWAFPGDPIPRANRRKAHVTNDSIAIQTGRNPATASFEFAGHATRKNFLEIPGGTHYAWAQSALFIGNDLYIWSQRVREGDWMVQAGWCVHRQLNAGTTNPLFWSPTLLHQSADTASRPVHSPHEEFDGYIYTFMLTQEVGWARARWPKTSLQAGDAAGVEYGTLTGWSPNAADAHVIADSQVGAAGSVQRRPSDGRWVMVQSGVEFPKCKVQIRMVEKNADGNFYPSGTYKPIEPHFQVGDRVDSSGDFDLDGRVVGIVSATERDIILDPLWDADQTIRRRDVSQLTMRTRTDRYFIDPPENYKPGTPNVSTYEARGHYSLSDPLDNGAKGYLLSYADNSDWLDANSQPVAGGVADDMSTYWPKFWWVLPPRIDAKAVDAAGLATWTLWGQWDRILVRVNAGAWIEVSPAATSYQAAAGDTVTIRAIGLGGEVTA